jgi:hypothetical protein
VHLATFMLTSRRARGKKKESGRAREAEEIVEQVQIIWCHTDALCFPENLVKHPEHTSVLHCATDTFRFSII